MAKSATTTDAQDTAKHSVYETSRLLEKMTVAEFDRVRDGDLTVDELREKYLPERGGL